MSSFLESTCYHGHQDSQARKAVLDVLKILNWSRMTYNKKFLFVDVYGDINLVGTSNLPEWLYGIDQMAITDIQIWYLIYYMAPHQSLCLLANKA